MTGSAGNGHAGSAGAATVDAGAAPGVEVARLVELSRTLAERNAQLERALESRIVIEQAKGMLAERLGVAPDAAFELLRRAARNHRVRIHGLAASVVESRATPPQIQELLE